jgi:SAM-dependent methyltransferase
VGLRMNQRVDFSSNARIYDRRHGALLATEIIDALARADAMRQADVVLDVGAGTGRTAVALADFGCDVLAIEPSMAMLTELRRKAATRRIWAVCGDGERLPCAASRFDAVVIARLLYLISDWQMLLRQAFAALRPGRHLLHEWGNGDANEPWVQIREKARSLFQSAGVTRPFHPGARSEADVDAYLTTLGLVKTAEVAIGPGPQMTLRDFIDRIMTGELSYTWDVPKQIQEQCLPLLKAWCDATFDLGQTYSMPQELHWKVFQKSPATLSADAGHGV